jgi:hypothetical protein
MEFLNEDANMTVYYELSNTDININSINPVSGHSFLMTSILNFNKDIFDFLIEIGIDVNLVSSNRLTSLDLALNLRDVMDYNESQIFLLDYMVEVLREEGALTAEEMNIIRIIHETSSLSEPSDPDYELMKQQAAQTIQKGIRNRQKKQKKGWIEKNVGMESPNPTQREALRRFTVAERMTDVNDPQKGYLHDIFLKKKK